MNFKRLLPRYARLEPPLFLTAQDLYVSDTVANHRPGRVAFGSNGRIFRYSLVGASNLVAGNLLQESAEDTTYENMAVTASPIVNLPGIQIVNVTNGTATITDAMFQGGSLGVYTAGGEAIGGDYDILGITGTLTTGGALVVTLDRPITTAWTTALKVVMKRSPWSGVIQAPASTQTGMAVGVAPWAIPTATYGWVQTHGPCTVLSDGSTFAVGSGLGTPSGTAGCVTVYAAGTTHQYVGVSREAAAGAHAISAFLNID